MATGGFQHEYAAGSLYSLDIDNVMHFLTLDVTSLHQFMINCVLVDRS
jgi:hypothetical protein